MISPFWIQSRPSPCALVTLRITELCVRHSNWMISTSVLLCTPRKPPCVFALEHRLDAIHEIDDLFSRLRLLDIQVHAHGVGAGAKLLVFRRGDHHHAQSRKFPAHDRQHLKAIHLRHPQIREQE